MSALDQLCIVMANTSHPGNIGAAARAMRTMGVHDLRLVNPLDLYNPQARIMASGADQVLDNAKVFNQLSSALADCQVVIGTSARSERSLAWPQLSARECGELVAERLPNTKVAILFGQERTGLTNEELEYCQYLTYIPMALTNYSLNIAAAIQVYCYECAVAVQLSSANADNVESPLDLGEALVTGEQLDNFYQHLEQTLIEVRYLNPDNPRLLMRRLKRLFGRVQLTHSEVNLLRGMLSTFQGKKFRPRER